MYEKINYTLVGLFVLIFSALAIYFGFWLAKRDVNNINYNYYYAYFSESVDGLNKDSIVKLNGVDVGRVINISVNNRFFPKVEVKLAIKKDIPIYQNMYAILKSQGVTGLRYINIELEDSNTSKKIEPNKNSSIIKTKESILEDISQSAPKVLDKLVSFTDKLDTLFNDKNLNNISKILENGKKITDIALNLEKRLNKMLDNNSSIMTLATIASDLNKSISSTLAEYKKLAKKGNISLDTINKKLPKILININKASKNLSNASYLVSKTIKRGDYNLKKILAPAIVNLHELSIEYKELAQELKAFLANPTNSLFNPKNLPKGPGEWKDYY